MSYCRWSSMNYMSDVYVYADMAGGWTVHVAKNRRVIPPIPSLVGGRISLAIHRWSGASYDFGSREMVRKSAWRAMVYALWLRFAVLWDDHLHHRSLDLIPSRPIGLPYDGDSYNPATAGECAEMLQRLREVGYRVPQGAIQALLDEEADDGSE